MKLAFCLFKYFPFGGLQRDFLRIAKACQSKGYQIYVYTLSWEGEIPEGFNLTLIPVSGITNHRRCQQFAKALPHYLTKFHFDAIIGFNRLPYLDIYYAADLCYEAVIQSKRHYLYRWTSRYKIYSALEKLVFQKEAKTKILLINELEQLHYQKYYGTPTERFYVLPPGIDTHCNQFLQNTLIRQEMRKELQIPLDTQIILMVGSSFNTKGVDRALFAFAALPENIMAKTFLINIGKGKAKPYLKMAKQLGIEKQVLFLGTRNDVARFYAAADILLHPSYFEAGGMVILEALVNGLPILTTANCGYAFHVKKSNAGIVIDMPFEQKHLNASLKVLLMEVDLAVLKEKALAYVAKTNFYQLTECAVPIIEDTVNQKNQANIK